MSSATLVNELDFATRAGASYSDLQKPNAPRPLLPSDHARRLSSGRRNEIFAICTVGDHFSFSEFLLRPALLVLPVELARVDASLEDPGVLRPIRSVQRAAGLTMDADGELPAADDVLDGDRLTGRSKGR